MENTMLIELIDQRAAGLLRELEELHLIKVIRDNVPIPKTNLSDKYRGIISQEQGKELKQHIDQMRGEWSNI